MKGWFITFEGVEGAGKTTQARHLSDFLRSRQLPVVTIREPGGTPLGERVRDVLLGHRELSAEAEMFLFLAARSQNTLAVIVPALAAGQYVVCDRYGDSTIAYQGYGRGLDLEVVRKMNAFATAGTEPHVTFVLDVPPECGLERQSNRTRMEEEPLEFHRRVREGYLTEARLAPHRFCVLDGLEDEHTIRKEILAELVRRGMLDAPLND